MALFNLVLHHMIKIIPRIVFDKFDSEQRTRAPCPVFSSLAFNSSSHLREWEKLIIFHRELYFFENYG